MAACASQAPYIGLWKNQTDNKTFRLHLYANGHCFLSLAHEFPNGMAEAIGGDCRYVPNPQGLTITGFDDEPAPPPSEQLQLHFSPDRQLLRLQIDPPVDLRKQPNTRP